LFFPSICSASLGVQFAEGPEVIQEDSEQHPYASSSAPNIPALLPLPYPEPTHPSAPSNITGILVTLDAQ
jgi:hypothetical protein